MSLTSTASAPASRQTDPATIAAAVTGDLPGWPRPRGPHRGPSRPSAGRTPRTRGRPPPCAPSPARPGGDPARVAAAWRPRRLPEPPAVRRTRRQLLDLGHGLDARAADGNPRPRGLVRHGRSAGARVRGDLRGWPTAAARSRLAARNVNPGRSREAVFRAARRHPPRPQHRRHRWPSPCTSTAPNHLPARAGSIRRELRPSPSAA